MKGLKTGGRKPGRPNKFLYFLEKLLSRNGYNYASELKKVLLSDLTTPDNKEKLKVLMDLLPYIAMRLSDTTPEEIEKVMHRPEVDIPDPLAGIENKAKEINNILCMKKDVADGTKN